MTTHPSKTAGQSQCAKILAALEESDGWVEMPKLSRLSKSLNVHSRIADLRRRGHSIEHHNERVKGETHSFYRLLP